ncbi:unnamed protein product [Closterium sp. NIES-53]
MHAHKSCARNSIIKVKRPPCSPPAFKASYVARGFSQRQGVDYFQNFSPTPKMTSLWVLLHIAAQRDYELHSLDLSIAFLQGCLHEEIWLRRPPGFTGRICKRDKRAQTWVLQRFGFQFSSPQPTPLSTGHSLLAPPSDDSVEPSGPYRELVGCLIYMMTTSGMGLVLGGRGPVVLTGHEDASWVDDSATQRSSQGYTFSLGSGSISWRSTRSSSVLSSSCEAEIYAGAMAAQELRWLTYLLTDLGEDPRLPPQRGQLRLAYVATRANTADIFTKALPPGDHQRFSTVLGLRWTGKVGNASVFRDWGSRAFVRNTSADKLSSLAIPCVFLGFPPDAPRWQFYHPTSRHVLSSQDATFDDTRCSSGRPLPPQGPAPSGVSQVDSVEPVEVAVKPVEVAVDSGTARGAEPAGAGPGGAEPGVAESEGAEPGDAELERVEPGGAESGGAELGGAESGGAESGGAKSGGAEPGGAELERAESGGPPGVPSRREPLSSQRLREWYARHCSHAAGATGLTAGGASGAGAAGGATGAGAAGAVGLGGAGAGGTGTVGGPTGVGATGGAGAVGPGGARTWGAVGGTEAGGAAGVVAGDPGAEGTGAVSAVSGGATWPRPYYVPLLQQVLGLPPSTGLTPPLLSPPPVQSQSQLQPASPMPGPSPYSGPTRGLTERRELESRPASPQSRPASPESCPALPVRAVCVK